MNGYNMKSISLFCGAGGFDLALLQAGFDIEFAVDFDKYAIQSYHANIGNHAICKDIRDIKGVDLPIVDLWTGGFPCQDLSNAGQRVGLTGKRSGLFFEIMRLLDEVKHKPKALIMENVKGLKPYLHILNDEFSKRGYTLHYALYNSKYWGVPQNRERYYIVGLLDSDWTKFQMPEQPTDYVPMLADFLDTDALEKYYVSDDKAKTVIEQALGSVGISIKHGIVLDGKSKYGKNAYSVFIDDIHPTILSTHYTQPTKVICQLPRGNNSGGLHEISPTISSSAWQQNNLLIENIKNLDNFRVRRLTPTEYGRLQAFQVDTTWRQVVSDSQAYKQFGNAVTVSVAKAVIEAVKQVL